MSMDIKSLRIGSHIDFNGRRVKIKAIVEDCVAFDYIQDEKIYLSPNAYDEFLSPIAITPELLKELGLNAINHGCSEHWFIGNFDLTHNTDSCYWDYEGDIRVEFLHELEDLYYLKYGVELIPD